ncbi:hypothetical protein OEA41_004770 [Lepraria neglecta]|uniref:Uncharacterized protein n=1 Tax=Lepraria neglecta TaxID=209136 RepID=A0AAD9Z2L6_9LECA|nr:hypothetical protein OEA41_004770 [Lepraria neglecta]
MFTGTYIVLLLPAIVAARPQYMLPGDTACGDEGPQYTTTSTADVTTTFGDQGWINYDGNVCEAGTAPCSNTEGTSVSTTIGVNFGGGPTFDLSEAVNAGLTFGVSVAFTNTKSQSGSVGRVAGFSSLLDDVPDTVSKQGLTEKQAQGLAASSQACRGVLEDLQKLIDKYGGLATEALNLTT